MDQTDIFTSGVSPYTHQQLAVVRAPRSKRIYACVASSLAIYIYRLHSGEDGSNGNGNQSPKESAPSDNSGESSEAAAFHQALRAAEEGFGGEGRGGCAAPSVELLHILRGAARPFAGMASDGVIVVAATHNRQLLCWDLESGTPLAPGFGAAAGAGAASISIGSAPKLTSAEERRRAEAYARFECNGDGDDTGGDVGGGGVGSSFDGGAAASSFSSAPVPHLPPCEATPRCVAVIQMMPTTLVGQGAEKEEARKRSSGGGLFGIGCVAGVIHFFCSASGALMTAALPDDTMILPLRLGAFRCGPLLPSLLPLLHLAAPSPPHSSS